MRVVILMPYRSTDEWREMAFGSANLQAYQTGWPVYEGDSHDEPFSIARTWNYLANKAGRWDIAIRWAADMVLHDPSVLQEAVETCQFYTRPFDEATKLNKEETLQYYNNQSVPDRLDKVPLGGISVNTRAMWETVGGFDPRFEGWGHEDRAFLHGVQLNYGKYRDITPGRLISLWHPRPSKVDSVNHAYWDKRQHNLAMLESVRQATQTPEDWQAWLQKRDREYPSS